MWLENGSSLTKAAQVYLCEIGCQRKDLRFFPIEGKEQSCSLSFKHTLSWEAMGNLIHCRWEHKVSHFDNNLVFFSKVEYMYTS